jgi:hypothetical protein
MAGIDARMREATGVGQHFFVGRKDEMSKVSRRAFIKAGGAVGAGAVTAAVAAPAIAQSTPDVRWRMPTSWPKSLDTLYGGAEWIAKRVAALTDNKFQIQPFAGGEIVPGLQVLDAAQNGTVECGHTAMYYYFGKDDTFVFLSALPFGMSPRMQNAWLLHGGGLDLVNDFLKSYSVYFLPSGNTNCQMGGWFRKPITKIDDLKGLKFRMGRADGVIPEAGPRVAEAGWHTPAEIGPAGREHNVEGGARLTDVVPHKRDGKILRARDCARDASGCVGTHPPEWDRVSIC